MRSVVLKCCLYGCDRRMPSYIGGGAWFFTRFNPFKKITKFFIDPAIKPATTTHMTEATTTTPAEKGRLFGMQIPADLDAELSRASAKLNLTKSALARLALQRGLVVVMEQLEGQTTEPADA